MDRGTAGAIVRVGMTNSRRAYPDHDLTRRRRWGGDLAQLEGLTGANQANGLHAKGGWTGICKILLSIIKQRDSFMGLRYPMPVKTHGRDTCTREVPIATSAPPCRCARNRRVVS